MLATGGLLGPVLMRWLSLELSLVLSILLMICGHILRSVSGNFFELLVGSVIAMLGMGIGNVLLPAIIKSYFPDRIALMTSLYAMLFSLGTAIPGSVAPLLAEVAGWRIALVLWGVLAFVALPPWLIVVLQNHRMAKTQNERTKHEASAAISSAINLWRSKIAWSLLLMYGMAMLNGYAMLAWLPEILHDTAGTSPVQAGLLLSLYALTGGPMALIAPSVAIRLQRPEILIYVAAGAFTVGYLGLVFIPATFTPLWVLTAAMGTGLFPVMLALINSRTRRPETAAKLSGFVHGLGALLSIPGPLIMGVLRTWTGGWTVPLLFLLTTVLGVVLSGVLLKGRHIIDDD